VVLARSVRRRRRSRSRSRSRRRRSRSRRRRRRRRSERYPREILQICPCVFRACVTRDS